MVTAIEDAGFWDADLPGSVVVKVEATDSEWAQVDQTILFGRRVGIRFMKMPTWALATRSEHQRTKSAKTLSLM